MTPAISWIPRWVEPAALETFEVQTVVDAGEPRRWRCERPRLDAWPAIGDGLRRASKDLARTPIADIVAVIDRVARWWCDPSFGPRVAARAEVVRATGFSPEAVDRSFDVELRNYQADSLWRVLRREFRDPEVLDGWRRDADLPGATRALGPELTLEVLTGNVPGLPALSLVRGLLVKSAIITKVASGEPTFAARFVTTLADADRRFGDAILCTYWARDEHEVRDAALDQVDTIIAYGGSDACDQMRRATRAHQRYVEHGHKLSAGFVSREYRASRGAELFEAIARDVSVFNQHACIAPQVYLVEGTLEEVREFAADVAAGLSRYAQHTPLGALAPRAAATLQLHRAADTWAAATSDERDLWSPSGLDWTVRLAASVDDVRGNGNRYLTIIPVADADAALAQLRPFGNFIQNVALGVDAPELLGLAESFARLGACRVCEPGHMADPSMMWRHDGRMCVAELVRWCDIEMHDQLPPPR